MMNNEELSNDSTYIPAATPKLTGKVSSSSEWRPSAAQLPGGFSDIVIQYCCPEKADRANEPVYIGSRIVYQGFDRTAKRPLILIFHPHGSPIRTVALTALPDLTKDTHRSRFAIDLSKHQDWWPVVEVVRLDSVLHLIPGESREPGSSGFCITGFLGMGGFGEVWSADDLRKSEGDPQRKAALKFFAQPEIRIQDLKLKKDDDVGHQLTVEAMRRGMEKFVIPIRDEILVSIDNDQGWPSTGLIMDVAGASLQDVIGRFNSDPKNNPEKEERQEVARLPTETVTQICQRLIIALAELHRRGFVHCDLKPANVLFLFPNGRIWDDSVEHLEQAEIVLGDLDDVTRIGEVSRTQVGQDFAGHRAPELMLPANDGKPSRVRDSTAVALPAEDQYALGIIFDALAHVVEGDGKWLIKVAEELKVHDPSARKPLGRSLMIAVSPTWQAMNTLLLNEGAWQIDQPGYERLIGREWLRDLFEEFCDGQRRKHQGGLFLLSAAAGLGKTAILTHWATADRLGCRSMAKSSAHAEGDYLHPAFYFRFGEGDSTKNHMIPAIVRQLQELPYEAKPPEGKSLTEITEKELREMLRQAVARLPRDRVLVLILDGLDEASDTAAPVQFLRNLCQSESGLGLPDRVFLLIAARPEDKKGNTITSSLAQMGDFVKPFELKQTDSRNLDDAKNFWTEECKRSLSLEQLDVAIAEADHAVASADGILFILRSAIDEIRNGNLTLKQFLEQEPCTKVNQWHLRQWERITSPLADQLDAHGRMIQLSQLLSVIRDPVPKSLFSAWMKQPTAMLEPLMNRLSWLITKPTVMQDGNTFSFYFRRHKSVLDFLTGPGGPAAESHQETNELIGNYYLDAAMKDSTDQYGNWENVDDYGTRHVVSHLLEASGRNGSARKNYLAAMRLLSNQLYLDARLNLNSRK